MRCAIARFALLALVPAVILGSAPCSWGATITVDSLTDDGTGCTLREAVVSANGNIASGGCASGVDTSDTIEFSASGTIVLDSPIEISEEVAIFGPLPSSGKKIVIKVSGNTRSFLLDSPGNDQQSEFYRLTFGGSTGGTGGGILVAGGDTASINECVFKRCVAMAGGAIQAVDGNVYTNRSLFIGNSATSGNGGAICVSGTGFMRLDNSTFSGNFAAGQGGAAWGEGQASTAGSTFAGNRAGAIGGGLYVKNSWQTITDSIFWGNAAPADPQIAVDGGAPVVTYCDVAGASVWPGTGNLKQTPRFISQVAAANAPTTAGNYHLKHTSPCIDAGLDPVYTGLYEIDGDQRALDGGYDIGSDEAGPPYNDSFEYGTGAPSPWQGANLTAADARDCTTRALDRCSFRFAGSSAAKSLKQVLPLSGSAGDTIHASAWSRSQGALPGAPYGLLARVRYTDGSAESFRVNFSRGTHGWQSAENSIEAAKDYADIVLTVRYARQAGFAWFDGVKVNISRP